MNICSRLISVACTFVAIFASAPSIHAQTSPNGATDSGSPNANSGGKSHLTNCTRFDRKAKDGEADDVPDLVNITIAADGIVIVEGVGTVDSKQTRRAYFFEVDLNSCKIYLRHANPKEQSELDRDSKARGSSNQSGHSKLAKPAAIVGGTAFAGAMVRTLDPANVATAESKQRLTWTWSGGGPIGSAGTSGYCYAYNPTALLTHWYNSFCNASPYSGVGTSQVSVSRSATYWNNDFVGCGGGTAYSAHSIRVIGYAGGGWTYYWSESHWGASCAGLLRGVVYLGY